MTDDLTISQEEIVGLLDKLLDAAIAGDFREVRKLAKKIHKNAQRDKARIQN